MQRLCGDVQRNADGCAASCILLCTSSDHRMEHNGSSGRDACVRIEQRRIYFGNYAKRNPIGRRRTDGSGTCSRIKFRGSMMKIVIPQAVKNILPTLGNEFIALIKETSVVSFVGAADLYVAFNYIGTNSYEFMVPYS